MPDLTPGRLRLWLAVFFLALAVPAGVLIHQAYKQLKWEAFHQHRLLAEEVAARVDDRFREMIREEEARPFTEYAFLNVIGDPAASFVQRSPLSTYPLSSSIPGLFGHFQIDADGAFTTPLMPASRSDPAAYGITGDDLEQRRQLAARMRRILSDNNLVGSNELRARDDSTAMPGSDVTEEMPAMFEDGESEPAAATVFDRLNKLDQDKQASTEQNRRKLGRVEDLKLDQRYQSEPPAEREEEAATLQAPSAPARAVRKEQGALPEPAGSIGAAEDAARSAIQGSVRVRTFESEVAPLEFSALDSGHFVLYRRVWRDGNRYVQGTLIEQQPFLRGMIQDRFLETALSGMSDLLVAYRGEVFEVFGARSSRAYLSNAEELEGTLLYQTRLSAPLGDLELLFSVKHLPPGPGARVINWVAFILVLVLCGGFYLMHRLGMSGIRLARQQQDFVSAVSHELKTPLTSIRMYGEMLREGWAPEEKKKTYYEFIHDESERLSRLINNVLQLSRMARRGPQPELKPVRVGGLIDAVRSKAASQVERAGFELDVDCAEDAGRAVVRVDTDYFTQIVINLVDNAVKFSAKAEHRRIEASCRLEQNNLVRFSVRDYGPGVPGDQMKKIFTLFFRSENELTRETVGTGIGLALVDQLAKAMNAKVDVVNRDPGAEFSVTFERTERLE